MRNSACIEWLFIIEEFVYVNNTETALQKVRKCDQSVDETLLIYDELQSSVSSEPISCCCNPELVKIECI